MHLINKTSQGCQRGGEEGERGLPPWQRECMQGTEQAGEMCSETNTGAEVKNTSWASTFFPAGKRTLRLEPSSCFHMETGVGTASWQHQGRGVEDSYGSRDEVFLCSRAEPRGSSDTRGTPAPPQAHPSCTFFMHLLWRLFLDSELPTHGSALEKHHTGKSALHQAQNRLKGPKMHSRLRHTSHTGIQGS